jgi:hypothetical protein
MQLKTTASRTRQPPLQNRNRRPSCICRGYPIPDTNPFGCRNAELRALPVKLLPLPAARCQLNQFVGTMGTSSSANA